MSSNKQGPSKRVSPLRFRRSILQRIMLIAPAMAAILMPVAPAKAQAQATNVVREAIPDLPGRYIYRPADFASRMEKMPVIVWANGGCSRNDQDWKGLYEHWAGAGYVVITMSEPGAKPRPKAEYDRIRALIAAEQNGTASPRAARPAGAGMPARTKETLDMQAEAIDWVDRSYSATEGVYAGKLDVTRIAAAGNSCGGVTSLHLAAQDPRVKSVYVLSGSSVGPDATIEEVGAVLGTVTAPSLWIVGGPEDAARGAAEIDFAAIRPETPAVLLRRSSFDHAQMTFEPSIQRDAASIGLTWFDATLRGEADAARLLITQGCLECEPARWSIWAKNMGE